MDAIERSNMIGQCKTAFDPEKERRTLQCAGIFQGNYANDPKMIAQICCERKVDAQISQQKSATTDSTTQSEKNLDKLAKNKNQELIKKEAEAKAMTLVADKQQEVLAQKTEIEKQATEKLTSLTKTLALALTAYLAFPPKLPAIDVKALAKKTQAKEKKESSELKQSESKENLKKGKESFKYPIKPTPSEEPKIVELPIKSTTPLSMKYYIEIIDRKGVWAVEVFDVTQSKSYTETVTYSKAKYPSKNDIIKLVTDSIRSTGYAGFPPQKDYTFP